MASKILEFLTENKKEVAFATLMAGVPNIVGNGVASANKETFNWWDNLKKPTWAPRGNTWYALESAFTVPVPFAIYKVMKAGGFDKEDTKMALYTFLGFSSLAMGSVAMFKKRDMQNMFYTGSLAITTLGCAAYQFYQVDSAAGIFLVPYLLYGIYTVAVLHQTLNLNPPDAQK